VARASAVEAHSIEGSTPRSPVATLASASEPVSRRWWASFVMARSADFSDHVAQVAAAGDGVPAIALLTGVQFVLLLDSSIVTIALPTLAHAFSLTRISVQWAMTAYVLPVGGFMIVGGRLGDLLGARRVLRAGLCVVALASLAAGLAPSWPALLGARAVQGLGGAAVAPAALSLLASRFEGPRLHRVLAINGGMLAAGYSVGLLLGGVLSATAGWRACLLVTVPIVASMALLVPRVICECGHPRHARGPSLLPSVLITLACLAISLVVTRAAAHPDDLAGTSFLGVLTVLLAVGFASADRRVRAPLVSTVLTRSRNMLGGTSTTLCSSVPMGGVLVLVAIFLQEVSGLHPVPAASVMAVAGLASLIGILHTPRMCGRWGERRTLFGAAVVQTIGLLDLTVAVGIGSVPLIALGVAIAVLGHVAVLVVSGALVVGGAAAADRGVASALLTAAEQLGSGVGVAVLVAVSTAAAPGEAGGAAVQIHSGTQAAMLVASAMAFGAAMMSRRVVGGQATRPPEG